MRLPWTRPQHDDPYWDAFIHRPPADANNLITEALHAAQPGGVNPVKGEIHSPNVMSSHIKDLARFFGADRVAVVQLSCGTDLPFAIVSALRSDYDTRSAAGIGGQAPVLKGVFVSFNLVAYIKELGYRATRSPGDGALLAGLAGVGEQGPNLHIAEVVYTDLPLEPDVRE
jgi:hypothetical protein